VRRRGSARWWYHECEYGAGSLRLSKELQGLGFGRNAMVVATAFTLGPTIASSILAIGPWTWLFSINIPFGIVAILKTLPRAPKSGACFRFSWRTDGCGLSRPLHSLDRKRGPSRAARAYID
jgi:hypothetical protein